jgi:PIN domain nuclease of toxin-antitoxin system
VGRAPLRLLLDTHIWVWSHLDPSRLGKRVAAALEASDAELWLSPISVWEFLLLVEKGRVVVKGDPAAWVDTAWSRVPMNDAALTREVAVRSRTIQVSHHDPADRFLAATADVFDLTLVTGDEHLLRGKGFRTLANR